MGGAGRRGRAAPPLTSPPSTPGEEGGGGSRGQTRGRGRGPDPTGVILQPLVPGCDRGRRQAEAREALLQEECGDLRGGGRGGRDPAAPHSAPHLEQRSSDSVFAGGGAPRVSRAPRRPTLPWDMSLVALAPCWSPLKPAGRWLQRLLRAGESPGAGGGGRDEGCVNISWRPLPQV